jgi:C-terminal processing protease CtpA/Prc
MELGSSQAAQIVRDGKPQTVQVVAIPLPKSFGLAGAILQDPKFAAGAALGEIGIKISDPTKAEIARLGYTGFKGALVKEVEPDGLAVRAGIRSGMLVVQVEKQAVHSAGEFAAAMKNQSLSKGVMLLVRTPEGGNRLVQLRQP